MKKIICCFATLSLLLSGCSDNLSKGDAAEMIKTAIEKGVGWSTMYRLYDVLTPDERRRLNNDGYVHGSDCGPYDANCHFIKDFTEKAKPFVRNLNNSLYLQITTVDKLVVNSINCGKKEEDSFGKIHKNCEATYEIKFKPNALGESLHNIEKLTRTGTARFYLVDKVWDTTAGLNIEDP